LDLIPEMVANSFWSKDNKFSNATPSKASAIFFLQEKKEL
jgi:hypothetical protein